MARYPIQLIPGLPSSEIALSATLTRAPQQQAAPAPAPQSAPAPAAGLGWINRLTPTALWRDPVEIGVYHSVSWATMHICGTPGVLRVRSFDGIEESASACPLASYSFFSADLVMCEALILGWQEGPTYEALIDESALTGTSGLSAPVFTVTVLPGRVLVEAGYGLLGQNVGDGVNVAGTATLTVSRDGSPIGSLDLQITDLGSFYL